MWVNESQINKGVVHITGFYRDYFDYSDHRYKTQGPGKFERMVNENLGKLIQVTLIPDQITKAPWLLPLMHKLGFEPVFTHKNPNTANIVRMFLRKPDLPEGFKAVAVKSWEPSKAPLTQNLSQLAYHTGGCCGYSDVFGIAFDKGLMSSSERTFEYSEKISLMLAQTYRTICAIKGEMEVLYRPGMAFQMFMPQGFSKDRNYGDNWMWPYLQKAGFNQVPTFSYLCPTNNTTMELYIACSNQQTNQDWDSLSKQFKFSLGGEETKEEKAVNPMYPPRDEYGRFASKAQGLAA